MGELKCLTMFQSTVVSCRGSSSACSCTGVQTLVTHA